MAPPSNRLQALKGGPRGQWSICFRWQDGDGRKVEIVDYRGCRIESAATRNEGGNEAQV